MIDKNIDSWKSLMENDMIGFLKSKDYPVFVGGSRRFGYSDERSDIDLMVSVSTSMFSFHMDLVAMGFTRNQSMDNEYESNSEVWTLGKLIHICAFRNEKEFKDLLVEHIQIENALKKNTLLKDFIKGLKGHGTTTGATIYRILRNVVLNNAE